MDICYSVTKSVVLLANSFNSKISILNSRARGGIPPLALGWWSSPPQGWLPLPTPCRPSDSQLSSFLSPPLAGHPYLS